MAPNQMVLQLLVACVLWRSSVLAPKPEAHYLTDLEEINEDVVLRVASKNQKQNTLEIEADVPALTDTSFPATVYNHSTKLVVVLFYIPFDPVGMLFLRPYQLAGRELAARKGGNSSSHPLARVDCYDWTDVCRKENVTTFPEIHVYLEGKWREQYRHALDKDVLVRSVFLLQCEQPLMLKTEEEVKRFVDGHLPDKAYELVDNLVLLKPSASMAEVPAFTEVVRQLETQMLFAIVSPDVPTRIGVEVGILHVRREDKHEPYDTLTHDLEAESIRHFLLLGKFPTLPELTFLNFPELHSRQQPLGILFLRPSDSEAHVHVRTVVDAIRADLAHNVTFCKMSVEEHNPMAEKILRSYTDQTVLPAFVLVDHPKGAVFAFNGQTLKDTKLLVWILDVQAGKIAPTKHLPREDWKPVVPHHDFLAKMDQDRKRKERREMRRRQSMADSAPPPPDNPGRPGLYPPVDEEEEFLDEPIPDQHKPHHNQHQDRHSQNENQKNQHQQKKHEPKQNQPQHHQNLKSRSQTQHQDQHQNQHQQKKHEPKQNQPQHHQNLKSRSQTQHQHQHQSQNQQHQNKNDRCKKQNANPDDPNRNRHHTNQNQHHHDKDSRQQNSNQKPTQTHNKKKIRVNEQDLYQDPAEAHKKRTRLSPEEKESSRPLPVQSVSSEDEEVVVQEDKDDLVGHTEL